MLRDRLLIGLGACFLAASGAWADEIGYVDCSKNADATQVFGKPRRSQDVVASLPCGERFTILVYGFYFSRIQTRDGQVGYIYSSLIAQDRGVTALQPAASKQQTGPQSGPQTPSLQATSEKTKIPRATPFDAQPEAATAAQPQAAPPASPEQSAAVPAATLQAGTTQSPAVEGATPAASATASSTISSNGVGTAAPVAQVGSSPAAEAQPAAAQPTGSQPASAEPPAAPALVFTAPPTAPAKPNADTAESPAATTQPSSNTAAETQPEAAQPAPTQPAPAAAAPAQPAPAQPAAPAIRPGDMKDSWEKPRPSVRAAPLLELYGGFALSRMGGTGSGTNSIGGLGSVAWNAKSWLQILADTSYTFETVSGAKNVLYGNHYGPRFFYRMRNRWGITPFGEALVGGSNLKTTISGSGGYTSSTGSTLSYKVGGGVDIHPSHRWEIRLIDVDYYKTSFGTNTHQTNYWISTGVVLRLFGGANE
ncbi:MAG TPA: SH3 domain-containing protein [Candidatus Acidoferrum sp.]